MQLKSHDSCRLATALPSLAFGHRFPESTISFCFFTDFTDNIQMKLTKSIRNRKESLYPHMRGRSLITRMVSGPPMGKETSTALHH